MKGIEDIRALLAFFIVAGFIAAAFAGMLVLDERFLAMKDVALLAIGFYFGNRATMDTPKTV
jgi:hypothetical protein